MKKSRIPQAIAAVAALATTLIVFSAVVSLADEDRAALAIAKIRPTAVAQSTDAVQR